MSADNDSADLEALFDSLAGAVSPPPLAKAAPDPAYVETVKRGDDAELEALFDQVSSTYKPPIAAAASAVSPAAPVAGGMDDIFFDAAPAPSAPPPVSGGGDFDGLFFEDAPGLAAVPPPAPAPARAAVSQPISAAPKSDLDDLFFDNAPGLAPSAPPVVEVAKPAASDLDDFLFASAPGLPGGAVPQAPAPQVQAPSAGGDSDALEDLFDQVASGYRAPAPAAPPVAAVPLATALGAGEDAAYNRIGHMARELHDTLMDLGYDKMLEDTMAVLPDAKDRLSYVANLTEKAACKVLNATDIAKPIVDDIESTSRRLGARWDALYANQMSVADFKALADETRAFLNDGLPKKADAANAQLLEIMMAQDFQDLTGQVIKRVVTLAQGLESGLLAALVELMPQERTNEVASLLNGPVISPGNQKDVVVNQEQVDDLLDSLGF